MGKEASNLTEYLLAGGIAGMVARTAIAPIERVKIMFQVSRGTQYHGGYMQFLPQIVQKEGPLSFWKGNTAAVVRVVPYMSITFLGFEEYRILLNKRFNNPNKQLVDLAAGSLGGLTAVALTYPLDTVRARLAMQNAGTSTGVKFKGVADALVGIARHDGVYAALRGVRALYNGMSATMMGVAPYAGLKFMTYEGIKAALSSWKGQDERDLPGSWRVVAGATAGLVAQTVVYPFDVIRRRSQTHTGPGKAYRSVWAAFTTIAREEGVRLGLYRGLSLNYLKTMPNVAIYMSLYDFLKIHLTSYLGQ